MFGVKVTNAAAFQSAVTRAIEAKRQQLALKVRDVAEESLKYATDTAPQFSGTFAGNFRLSVSAPNPGRDQKPYDYWAPLGGSQQEGDAGAVGRAKAGSAGALNGYKFGQAIYLSTTASNAEDNENYAWDIEANIMRFRPVNPSRGRVLGRTKEHAARYAKTKFKGK